MLLYRQTTRSGMVEPKTRRGLNLPAGVFEKVERVQKQLAADLGIPTLSKAQALDRVLSEFLGER